MQFSAPMFSHLIVVAGGSGERLGGVDKALCEVGGRRLVDHALDVPVTGRRIVVRPSDRAPIVSTPAQHVEQVAEQPAGGGPAAGLAAAVAALTGGSEDGAASAADRPGPPVGDIFDTDELVAVLACDAMAPVAPVMAQLGVALRGHPNAGVAVAAPGGLPQWLTAVWRLGVLIDAVGRFGDPAHAPARLMVALGRPIEVSSERIASLDGPLDLLEGVASGASAVGVAGDGSQRSALVAALTADSGWRAVDAIDPAEHRASVLTRSLADAQPAANPDHWVLAAQPDIARPSWAAARIVPL